jgi:hypothetical protein
MSIAATGMALKNIKGGELPEIDRVFFLYLVLEF